MALDHHLGYPSTIEVVRMGPMAGIKVTGLAALAGMEILAGTKAAGMEISPGILLGVLAGTKAVGMETLPEVHLMDTIPGAPRLTPLMVEAGTLLILVTADILPTTMVTEEVEMV